MGSDPEPEGTIDAAKNAPDAMPPWPDAQQPADAPVLPDAAPVPDSPPTPDANLPDAAGSGIFCNSHAECTVAGECCFYILEPPGLCVEGEVFLEICIPN